MTVIVEATGRTIERRYEEKTGSKSTFGESKMFRSPAAAIPLPDSSSLSFFAIRNFSLDKCKLLFICFYDGKSVNICPNYNIECCI
jgi:hypothetical protein